MVQPYREHFEKLGGAINSLDPEIKLATRFSVDNSNAVVSATTSLDEDQEVDDFVSSQGFEFIDGNNDSRARVLDLDEDSPGESFANDSCTHIPVNFVFIPFTRTIGALVAVKLMPGFRPS